MKKPTLENALAFAADLIRIPSLPGEEEALGRRVVEEMEALGFDRIRVDALGSVIGVIPGRGEAPPVMVNAHLDMVAAGDPAEWEYPPFEGVVADGCLHGRGAMDIKGPLGLQTYAAAALRGQAAGDIIVAHTVFEERGGWGMAHLLESKEVAPAAVIIGEATHGDIALGHRGRAEVEVVLQGVAGHASAPGRASNALDLLPGALEGIHALSLRQEEDETLGAATLVATAVDVLPESRNVIPDRVTVTIDWRVLPGDREETLLPRVEDALARAFAARPEGIPEGASWQVRMGRAVQRSYTGESAERKLLTPGFLMSPDHPVTRAAALAVGRRDGPGPALTRPWGFATDGGWSCGVQGIPTVGFAPGEERFAHTNRERLDIEEA
ncbi:MAG: M20/M25/M40 family metallo-hydrolase, partial [Gemmatimonadota bacterium]